jgi:hypothetical protein
MTQVDKQTPDSPLASTGDARAIEHLEQAIKSGRHWYLALLEAIGMWVQVEEVYNGRTYRYVIAGEALDWLLLAERLCQAVDSLIPKNEQTALLFYGQPPLELSREKFKELIGSGKYRQYLNYFYGVVVEEALILAVQEEVRKEKLAYGYSAERDTTNEAYRRIYDTSKGILLRHFRQEKGYKQVEAISLTEMKEFTYWLFKYRVKRCDKAKVASDTKKALNWLKRNGFKRPDSSHSERESLNMLPPSETA